MKISIGGDHAGFEYKKEIIKMLREEGYKVKDFGPFSEESVDYPDFAHPVSQEVENQDCDFGILICGSANGVAMTANKYQNIRAGICWMNEITKLTRQHNNANICCIPARYTSITQALQIVNTFLETKFEGGRHQNRVNKIPITPC